MFAAPSRLTPGAQVVGRASNDTCTCRPAISHPEELHVHRSRLRIPKALTTGQELLERMGQQLICDHVLAARYQLAGCDLVEICGELAIARLAVHHICLE